jgi:arylsulfatase A-like enzyme
MLRELGLYDEALILVTSDHGESLGTHGQIGHGGLFLEQLMVPLIIKFPSSWSWDSQVVEDPVELVDVMPTILGACGIEAPPGLDGRSLIAAEQSPRRHLVAQMAYREGPELISNPAKRALLEPGRWLLIHDARSDRLELFDLGKDPEALTAVAMGARPGAQDGSSDDIAAALPGLLAALAALDAGRSADEFVEPAVEMDEEMLRALKSLGYVGP